MADVTINQLTGQAPTTNDVFPFSTAVSPSTYKASLAQIKTALAIPAAQIQSDWTQTNTAALDYIKNKPATGKVLQMQTATKSDVYVNSASTNVWTDIPGMSVSITTVGVGNKVLIQANINGGSNVYHTGLRLVRNGATYLGLGAATGSRTAATCGGFFNANQDATVTSGILFADTPGAIGTYVYKVQVICPQNTTVAINTSQSNGDASYTMVTTSVITATEIAA